VFSATRSAAIGCNRITAERPAWLRFPGRRGTRTSVIADLFHMPVAQYVRLGSRNVKGWVIAYNLRLPTTGPVVTDGSTTTSDMTTPNVCEISSAQVCWLRFGGHHDHGGPVGIQRVRELVCELFAAVHTDRPTPEPCCKGGDIEAG